MTPSRNGSQLANNKIIVNEMVSGLNLMLGMVFGFIIAIIFFMVGIKLSDIFPDIPIGFGILILVIFLVGPMAIFMYFWSKITRKRIAVTPILHVDEKVPISKVQKETLDNFEGARLSKEVVSVIRGGSVNLLAGVAQTAIIAAAKRDAHVKYTLCEEGIVVYRRSSGSLCSWKRISKLTSDPKNKQLEFKVRGVIGKWNIFTPNKFDETKQILSKYIEVK